LLLTDISQDSLVGRPAAFVGTTWMKNLRYISTINLRGTSMLRKLAIRSLQMSEQIVMKPLGQKGFKSPAGLKHWLPE
jgi:hypothetical protein